jgi:hypothetical protein
LFSGVSDRIRVQAGPSVAWWILDDEMGAHESRAIQLQTDDPGHVRSSACDGKFLVADRRNGRGWTAFREGQVFREFREAPQVVYLLDIGHSEYALLVQDDGSGASDRRISVDLIE